MTTTYDEIPPEFLWLVDGMVRVGDEVDFMQDLADATPRGVPVRGLWRLVVDTSDGDDEPMLVLVK